MHFSPVKLLTGACMLGVVFWMGWASGANAEIKKRVERDLVSHKQALELGRAFMAELNARPGVMDSGEYVLDYRIAGEKPRQDDLSLEFENGRLLDSGLYNFNLTGNIVSWSQVDYDEGPVADCVGIIDGEMIWGLALRAPGQGWRLGEPPALGLWKISA